MKRKEIMDLAPSENQSEDQIKTEKPETPVSCKNVQILTLEIDEQTDATKTNK